MSNVSIKGKRRSAVELISWSIGVWNGGIHRDVFSMGFFKLFGLPVKFHHFDARAMSVGCKVGTLPVSVP